MLCHVGSTDCEFNLVDLFCPSSGPVGRVAYEYNQCTCIEVCDMNVITSNCKHANMLHLLNIYYTRKKMVDYCYDSGIHCIMHMHLCVH